MRGAVRFDVRGNDGEVDQWVVAVDRGAVTVSHGSADADCVISADGALFERLIDGEENAISAVLRGALRVSGDRGRYPGVVDGSDWAVLLRHPASVALGPDLR